VRTFRFALCVLAACAGLMALTACEEAKPAAATHAGKDATAADAADASDAASTDTIARGEDAVITETIGTETTAPDASLADAAKPKFETCMQTAQCFADKCNPPTAGCDAACTPDSSPAALAGALPMLSCYQTKCLAGLCKDSKDPGCGDQCFKSACLPELFACLDDGKPGIKPCETTKSCFDTCKLGKPDTFACLSTCFNTLDAGAKVAAKTMAACFAKNPGPDPTKSCIAETIGCFVGDKSGNEPCFTVFQCSDACKKAAKGDDFTCSIGCLGKVSKAGQKAFTDMVPCLGNEKDPVCAAKFLACADPVGTADCLGGLGLIDKCQKASGGGDNPQCIFEAVHAMTKEAAMTLMEVSPCLDQNDPASAQKCMPLLLKCVNPNGTSDCGAVATCMQTCPKDTGTCMFGCLKQGSKDAASAAWAAAMCSSAAPPGDVTKCATEIGGCYGDPKGTGTCAAVLGCAAACGPNGGPNCLATCLKGGTPQVAIQVLKAAQCFGKTDPACTPNLVTCLAPKGTKKCFELTPCLVPCNGKTGKELTACQFACLDQGSSEAVTQWFDFAGCDQGCKAKCPNDDSGTCALNCQKATCPTAQTACLPPKS